MHSVIVVVRKEERERVCVIDCCCDNVCDGGDGGVFFELKYYYKQIIHIYISYTLYTHIYHIVGRQHNGPNNNKQQTSILLSYTLTLLFVCRS